MDKVKEFYNGPGWDSAENGDTKDAQLWEDLRPCAKIYISDCRRRILNELPKTGQFILDAASGPIQYPEYLEYSQGFEKRVCVDISQKALDIAKKKLGNRGEFHCADITSLPFQDSYFDSVISLHTVYHIDSAKQDTAVRQLLRVAKPGAPVVIIYSNPDRILARLKRMLKATFKKEEDKILYFSAFPLKWWKRFEDVAEVTLKPWRSLTAKDAHTFIPDNFLGRMALTIVFTWERLFPKWAVRWGTYPMIILKKK